MIVHIMHPEKMLTNPTVRGHGRPCTRQLYYFRCCYEPCCLLFQPSLSVGNVGQLAVDILLATLKAERVGGLFHSALLPVVGSDPLLQDSDQLMTACQGQFTTARARNQSCYHSML